MADPFLFPKTSRGRKYWYIGQNKRENGRVVRDWEIYIGTTERILEAHQKTKQLEAGEVELNYIAPKKFGAEAAALSILQRLKFKEFVNAMGLKKRTQGLDLGSYLELMVLNRVVEPRSKSKIKDWYKSSFLFHFESINPKKLDSQRFWDHMSYFDQNLIEKLEYRVINHMIKEFDLQLGTLLYDPTNFSTYINPNRPHELARYGKSKSKRKDLLQINLTIFATKEDGIPVLHHTYPGNVNDPTEFRTIFPVLFERYEDFKISNNDDYLSVIFDKGNNSASNIESLRESDYNFVGSLRPSTQKDLLSVPLELYNDTIKYKQDEEELNAYRVKKHVYGNEFTLVLTYSRHAANAAKAALNTQIEKTERKLEELTSKIGQPYYRNEKELKEKLRKIISKRQIKGLIDAELITPSENKMKLVWSKNQSAINVKIQEMGKRILFTDHHEWSTQEIIDAYASLWRIEQDFHELKSADYIRLTPMYHWTVNKIRLHLFVCIMALIVQRLLHREVKRHLPELSIAELFEELRQIYEVGYTIGDNPDNAKFKVSKLNNVQKQLMDVLDLNKFLSN